MDSKRDLKPSTSNAKAPKLTYKHFAGMAAISGCPKGANAPFKGACYCSVKADVKDPNNFVPAAVRNPTHRHCCIAWGLSFYETLKQLCDNVAGASRTAPKFREKYGDHYAEMQLTIRDGTRTHAAASGHFTFFEFATFMPSTRIRSIAPLP